MKTILLTGATGYLGTNLLKAFLKNEYRVIAVCLNKKEQLDFDSCYENNVKKIYLDTDSIESVFDSEKIDIIVHTATVYGRANEGIEEIIKANVIFPLKILQRAVKNKVSIFVNADSMLDKSTSIYAMTKFQFKEWLDFFSNQIKVVNLTMDQFYGPNERPTKFIAWLIDRFKNNVSSVDLTAGTQTRDFIYVEDVVSAFVTVVNNMNFVSQGCNNFEVGTGTLTSVHDMVLKVQNLFDNKNTKLNFGAIPLRTNELSGKIVKSSELRNLGWSPQYSVDAGLAEIKQMEGIK